MSDFGFPSAAGATAPAGETAVVSFPLRYTDGARLGAQDVALQRDDRRAGDQRDAAG